MIPTLRVWGGGRLTDIFLIHARAHINMHDICRYRDTDIKNIPAMKKKKHLLHLNRGDSAYWKYSWVPLRENGSN